MRGSLRGIRSRVERLARHMRDGCTACRGDEAKIRYHWRDTRSGSLRSVNDELADRPQVETCAACGRTYPLRYVIVGWGRESGGQDVARVIARATTS